ncbi:hypothetical protein GYMLUDRAFT_775367 [Collybiopsis luxurians FD-317 M1]|uniref:Uncharacterized protein n=1 Tax=Collybiopsis luxurians FD-317 M1 TaxID=944289 RepID=A0A0D0C3D7_9AGAR|nr:hypothetical protein GYMLUDRAFT_775367 [Collybiopsis luxurians FD-317 M1]
MLSIDRAIGKWRCGYFASRVQNASSSIEPPPPQPPVSLSTAARRRTASSSKPSRFNGSAYGYSS